MTDHNIPVTEDEFHAYVDNELPVERRAAVEAWLAAHPEDAERVTSWRAMSDALHAKYDSVADEPVPPRLSVDQLSRTPRRWMMGAIAASLLAFAVGGGIGWVARGRERNAVDVRELHRQCARRAQTLCGRGAPSRRGGGQREGASATVAEQALRLGSPRARTRRHRPEARRRPAAARPHRPCIVPDV